MSKKKQASKWSKYTDSIESSIRKNPTLGYTELARDVLGKKTNAKDENILRTYIRRNFGDLKRSLTGIGTEPRLLIYDLETSRAEFSTWWTGKQYLGTSSLTKEPSIISVSWKWLGEDEIYALHWDMKTHCDKEMVREFLKVYNSADMVIGINSDRFDSKWLAARAIKHRLPLNIHVKSFDVQKKLRSLARLPGYSMKFVNKYFNLERKLSHEGMHMRDMVEKGTDAEQREYIDKMIEYNKGDIMATEDQFLTFRPYMKAPIHLGVFRGNGKSSCPHCGGDNIELFKTTVTAAGTIQRIMRCVDDGVQFKISNKQYISFLEDQREF